MKVERIVYTVEEMREALGVSRTTAYALTRVPGFPIARLGGRIVVLRDGLNEWLRNGGVAELPECDNEGDRR